MGIGAAPALCRMVLIVAEMRSMSSKQYSSLRAAHPSLSWGGLRFIDDARLVLLHPRGLPRSDVLQIFIQWSGMLWPSCLPWKADAVNPMVGLFVFTKNNKWRWMPEPKSYKVVGECRFSSHTRPTKSFQDFSSWIPPKVQKGILLSVWAKCKAQTSSDHEFVHASIAFAWALFRCHRFSQSSVVESLADWAQKPKNGGGSALILK